MGYILYVFVYISLLHSSQTSEYKVQMFEIVLIIICHEMLCNDLSPNC